ncbi:IS21-like element helper ATPase IstB [Herbaspirillum aquaticum]|uniref:IS21-like element helper ATPase IstB n=1 Tax=Herbaspirillum aquaticum TaxID=568783 RepID=UPI0024DE162F|nr:IS21-like element helper ATPase IstB [Herbaspirillum aquaticum]
MMNHHTREKLIELRLPGMAAEFDRQIATPGMEDVPYEQRISQLVDHEITLRSGKKTALMIKRAALPQSASIEDVDYGSRRGLDKSSFLSLASMDWVRRSHNIVITGPTGTGKSWLACALALQACRQGLPSHFARVPLLMENLGLSRATGSFLSRLDQLQKFDLLVLDDLGISALSQNAQSDLLEVIEKRVGNRSTIITSQFPLKSWHELFDIKTVADAVMDRVIHSSHRLELSGESLRKKSSPHSKPPTRKAEHSS